MVEDLAVLTATIAVGFFLAVAFYESLSSRDVLIGRVAKLAGRFTKRHSVIAMLHVLTVLVCIPVLVAVWAIVLEAALVVFGLPDRLRVAESAVAIVAAARVLAYVREKTAQELAKAIPIALAFSLLIGGLAQLEENLRSIVDEPFQSDLTVTMVAFLVALEIGLRLATDLTRTVAWAVKKRRQEETTPDDRDEAPLPE